MQNDNPLDGMFDILHKTRREDITDAIASGEKAGLPMPAPRAVLVDLTTHAVSEAMRVLRDNFQRAQFAGGVGTSDLVLLLAMRQLSVECEAVRAATGEAAKQSLERRGLSAEDFIKELKDQ